MLYNCPFCAQTESEIYKVKQHLRDMEGTRNFYRCSECQTIYPRPRNDSQENLKYLESVEKDFNGGSDPLRPVSRLNYSVELLKHYTKISHIKKALDIGSYDGQFCYILKTLGIEAYGLEPQKKVVEYAQSKGLRVYYGSFPEQIPQELEKFKYDLISINEVIYYFVNIKESLNKIYNLLSNGGILFIKCHQGNSYYYRDGHSLFSRYGNYAQSVPTVSSLTYWLNDRGFKIKEILPVPDQYFHIISGISRDRFPWLQKVFNKIYGIFINKGKWINRADRLVVIANKNE